jgi:glycosyltransferase involved in cell wall biosynthesis
MKKNNPLRKETIFINGRFLTQPITGVQRFAFEIITALDQRVINNLDFLQTHNIICLVPNEINQSMVPQWDNIIIQRCGILSGNFWEQIELPFFSRNGLLVNLCNIGPIMHHKQIVVFHDASVYAYPKTYSFGFRLKYYLFMGILSHTVKKILTVSQFSKKELSHYLGIGEETISVISEGCEHILRTPPDDRILVEYDLIKTPFLLAVGNESSQKNLSIVINTIEQSDDHSIPLAIAGGGFNKIFKKVKKTESPKVIYLGYVTDEQLRSLYSHALGFVFSSLYEGFGLPPLEAMICGCPVICSNKASMPEICGNAVEYFNPINIEELIHLLGDLVKNEALQNELRKRGYEQAKLFTWEKAADLLITYLK